MYMAPGSGWASLECSCESPNDSASGTVVESAKGLEFRYANGAPLSDDDFEGFILDPIEAAGKWAKWEEDWLAEADAGVAAEVMGWTARIEAVLKSVIAGRR